MPILLFLSASDPFLGISSGNMGFSPIEKHGSGDHPIILNASDPDSSFTEFQNPTGELSDIGVDKTESVPSAARTPKRPKQMKPGFWIGLITVFSALGISAVIVWNRFLRRRMELKAKEFEKEPQFHRKIREKLQEKTDILRLIQEINSEADMASSVEEVIRLCLEKICIYTGYEVGHLYEVDSENTLIPSHIWSIHKQEVFKDFKEITEVTSFKKGEGLPGRVQKSGKPEWIPDVTKDPNFSRARVGKNIGITSAFALPILERNQVVAILEFFTRKNVQPDEGWIEAMEQLALPIGRITERKKAEQRWFESESTVRAIIDTIVDGIITINQEGIVETINTTAAKIFQYEIDDLIGKKINVLIPEPFHSEPGRNIENFILSGVPKIIGTGLREAIGKRKDGSVFPLEISITEVKSRDRRLFVGWVRDITEQNRIRQAIIRSERMYSNLVSNLPGFSYRCRNDKFWTMEFVSDGIRDLLGYRPEDLIPPGEIRFPDLIHPEDRGMIDRQVQESLRNRKPYQLVYRLFTAQGQEKWVLEQGRNADPSGKSLDLLEGIILDVTGRVLAEKTLEESGRRLKMQRDAIAHLGKNPVLFSGNLQAAVREITETAAKTLSVERVGVWLYNEDRSAMICQDLFQLGTDLHSITRDIPRSDFPVYFQSLEEERTIAANDALPDPRTCELLEPYLVVFGITSMLDVSVFLGGELVGLICHEHIGPRREWTLEEQNFANSMAEYVALSIQENERFLAEETLRRAKAQLEAAVEIKDKFVSLVSHDLRSPFNAFMGFLELLRIDAEGQLDHSNLDTLDQILKSGRNLIRMIDDVLNLSRLQTGKISLNRKFFDGNQVSGIVIENHKFQAVKKGITVFNEVPVNTRLFADPELFIQVIQNMVSNAMKFCPTGGHISIFVPEDGGTTIAVRDDGIGIPKEMLPDLFKYEIKTSTIGTAGEKGTGLGLPLCQEIMKLHGGFLKVESEEGKGSTFFAGLPYVRPQVFVVDDSREDRFLTTALVKKIDADILEAENGEEALNILNQMDSLPHLIVSDIDMPILDGFGFLEKIRAIPRTKSIPVIMLTSDTKASTRERVVRMGANDFVSKPPLFHDFIPRLEKFLT